MTMTRFTWFALLLLALLLTWQPAHAQSTLTVNFGWVPPTTHANGTPLATGELTGYRIYGMSGPTNPTYSLIQAVAGGTTTSASTTIPAPAAGTCITDYFAITAITTVESALSAIATLTLCPAMAPTGTTVTTTIIFIGK